MTTEADTTIEREKTGDAAGERTRRAVLAGSAVGAAALLGTRPTGVAAAVDGDPIVAGGTTTATSRTNLRGPSLVVTDGAASGSLAREVVPGVVAGVHGFTSDDTRSRAVWGLDETDDGVGVYGQHTGPALGTGVVALSDSGSGLVAEGTAHDVELRGSGSMWLRGDRNVTSGTAGPAGVMVGNDEGTLWYSTEPNRFRRIAGPNRASTFTPIEPTRAYDSRSPQPEPGVLPVDGERIVSVRLGRDLGSGVVIDGRLIALDAIAVSFNLTAINTFGRGFLAVSPGDALAPRASTLNWRADGELISNSGIAKLDANGNVKVFAGGQFGYTDFFLDVTGYYA